MDEVVEEVVGVDEEGPMPWRRVSWRPGAEGAPAERRWVKVVGWVVSGTMRRDYR